MRANGLLALAGLLLAVATAIPWAPPAARAAAPSGPVLRLDWGAEPSDLNPVTAVDQVSFDVLNAVMEGLTRIGSSGQVTPGIASGWTVQNGGRTYVFHLRNARWSNGDPVTAMDFVYAWDQVLNPCIGSQYASQMRDIAGAASLLALAVPPTGCDTATAHTVAALEARLGVRAAGVHTLVVRLSRPVPYWLSMTALPTYFPLDQPLASRWGMQLYGSNIAHMVFDGPFVIRSWVPNAHLDLVKNPNYWDARHVYLAGVDGLIVTDAATAVNLYQTGQLDVLTQIPSQFISVFQRQAGYRIAPQATVTYLEMNVSAAPFSQPLVRQAFSLAIDRAALVRAVVQAGQPAYALTPPGIDYAPGRPFSPLVGHPLNTHAQPAAARAALAAGLRALHLHALPPLVLLTVNTTDARHYCEALQAMWQQMLGVTVQLNAVDAPTYLKLLQEGQFNLAFSGWDADYNDPTTFLNLWTKGSGFNSIHWHSATYDRYLAEAAAARSTQTRGQDLARAERTLLAQLPVAPLYWPERAWIAHRGVSGFVWYQTGPDFSLKGVRVSGGA